MRLRKLIVQIPCKNEFKTLPATVAEIPRKIPGVDKVEILVIDDGSSDETTRQAVSLGVEHVLRFATNRGLARTFDAGLRFAIYGLEADTIVNTDGDNQYQGAYVKDIVEALLRGDYGMVVGRRDLPNIPHFSLLKKIIISIGSRVIGVLSGFPVEDAPSGFRAFSRRAAMRLTILSQYTYTLETLVQAKAKGVRVGFIPIQTNPKLRGSRLMKSLPDYLIRTFASLLAIVLLYRPEVVFGITTALAALLVIFGSFFSNTFHWIAGASLLFLSGFFFAVICKILVTHRTAEEEQLLWIMPALSAAACAARLGATNYYHNGRDLLSE